MSITQIVDHAIDPNPWPELIPFKANNLPSLDTGDLPNWLGDYAQALSVSLETPTELAIGLMLAAASTCTARRLVVEAKLGYREPTNLWVTVALEPGNRKSAVESMAKAPLMAWETFEANRLKPEIDKARSEKKVSELRIKSLLSAIAKPTIKPADRAKYTAEMVELERGLPVIPTQPRLWISDVTPERIGTLLVEHGECLALLSSEGGIFDVLGGRYSKGESNLDLVLKAHAGDSDRLERLSRESVELKNPRITMGLSPQPDVLRSLADKQGFIGRGLLARFLWLFPESPLGYRTHDGVPVAPAFSEAYNVAITAMLNWPAPNPGECHVIKLSDEARNDWQDFQRRIEILMRSGNALENHHGWAGKAPGAALRLAGVLHGAKHAHGYPWDHAIELETIGAALALMTPIIQHSTAALNMMGASGEQQRAERLLDWLIRRRQSGWTVREIHRANSGMFSRVKEAHDVLDVLEERGYVRVIEPEPSGNGGRPPSPAVIVRTGLWHE